MTFADDRDAAPVPGFTGWAWDREWHAGFVKGAIEEAGLRYLGTFDGGGGFVAFTDNVRAIKRWAPRRDS